MAGSADIRGIAEFRLGGVARRVKVDLLCIAAIEDATGRGIRALFVASAQSTDRVADHIRSLRAALAHSGAVYTDEEWAGVLASESVRTITMASVELLKAAFPPEPRGASAGKAPAPNQKATT